MSWFDGMRFKVRSAFDRGKIDEDLDREMRSHIEDLTDEGIAAGMSPREARRIANLEFGNRELFREESRDVWSLRVLFSFFRDMHLAGRRLLKNKLYSGSIVVILALCVGLNASLFNGLYRTVISPYVYPDLDRVVMVGLMHTKEAEADTVVNISPIDFLDIEERQRSFSSIGFYTRDVVDVRSSKKPKLQDVGYVTSGIWDALEVAPIKGNLFTKEEVDNEERVAVLSYPFWMTEFGGDINVVGTTIEVNGESTKVIGVMPESFSMFYGGEQLWMPKIFSSYERSQDSRGNNSHSIIARLNPGVSYSTARADLAAIHADYVERYPEDKEDVERSGEMYGIVSAKDWMLELIPMFKPMYWGLQVAGSFIFLIGCFNTANLMLASGIKRIPELGLRMSLGASRTKLGIQLVTENGLLFLLAGIISVFVSKGFDHITNSLLVVSGYSPGRPLTDTGSYVGFTIAALLVAMILTSLSPLFLVSSKRLLSSFNGRVGSSKFTKKHRLQGLFVTGQVGLTCFLLICSGMFLSSMRALLNEDIGYEIENRMALKVSIPEYRYGSRDEAIDFQEKFVEHLREHAQVEFASISHRAPLDYQMHWSSITLSTRPLEPGESKNNADWFRVEKDFFDTMGIKLQRGRFFENTDTRDSERVVIASRSLEKYSGEDEVLGAVLNFWGGDYKVIGIVNDTKDSPAMFGSPDHTLYFLASQFRTDILTPAIMVKHLGDPVEFEASLQRHIASFDPDLEVNIRTMRELQEEALVMQRMPVVYLSIFTGLAIVLSTAGLYGFISYLVQQSRTEFGIRLSMGATKISLILQNLKRHIVKIVTGLLAGVSLGLLAARSSKDVLYGVDPSSPTIYVFASLILLFACLAAIVVPVAYSASRSPMESLRAE